MKVEYNCRGLELTDGFEVLILSFECLRRAFLMADATSDKPEMDNVQATVLGLSLPSSFEHGDFKRVNIVIKFVMLSGYHSLPHVQHYWSTQPDMGVPLVYNTMSRNRFMELKKYIHFSDNQKLTKGDKMSKVTPLYDMLNKLLAQFGVFHSLLSEDEPTSVPYFGRHSAKMFIRGTPIRFGYKIWMLCGNDGYPCHMSIYSKTRL
ncbi:PiggyBac transposable element-derived protein 3 [Trichinella zimbabwensis]|uniref:PiggyBac transposable element-derived protein 3 n=1 Tax=Trichinella zimbabwensis TaxID=268475 RepID=A0A0V1HFB8_9BILA|nr:PiggyBac transposable element-derived protein 3 [Trichinella zimbabwensis]